VSVSPPATQDGRRSLDRQPRDRSRRSAAAPARHTLLKGARFAAITEDDAVRTIVDAATTNHGHWTVTANLDHLRRYLREPLARELIDGADLVVADGMPLIWASRLVGALLPERVTGSNMIWSISEAARARGQSVFLLGGEPGVADRAADVLTERYRGLRIAGTLCPPPGFETDPDELERIQDQIVTATPQIIFVALGFPKQDLLIRYLRPALPQASYIGVGISLSYITGEVPRAPAWMHTTGLEWLYRLVREPKRLARRYLFDGFPFAIRLLMSATFHRVYSDALWGSETDGSLDFTDVTAYGSSDG
jgi:N-acetylglucosaminyldiphosphoundecaprenol N-acetyl-beta-D-mannosaminyltransferase